MPPRKQAIRDEQPFTGGFGKIFTSPIRRSNPKRPNPSVAPLGNDLKRQRLAEQIAAFQRAALAQRSTLPQSSSSEQTADVPSLAEESIKSTTPPPETPDYDCDTPFSVYPEADASPLPRRTAPNRASQSLYIRWNSLIPILINPFLTYSSSTKGKVPDIPNALHSKCRQKCQRHPPATVICLFHTHFSSLSVYLCECQTLPEVLLSHGLFPTAPTNPRMAVSVHLLDFYQALFERSCDAVNALSQALNSYYRRRGFTLSNQKGQPIQDAFRRGLGYAMQWYDKLQISIEDQIEAAIVAADSTAREAKEPGPPTECSRILQRRCPACFGGNQFGRPFSEGGDVHVCVDGNFNHRHLKSSGSGPKFYEPEYMLAKLEVDAVGNRIDEVRRKPPKARKPKVPDEAVDECEATHVSGSGSNSKTNMDKFDDSGVMALVCRHDIPVFLANIDTPGEQQKYAFALIEHLMALLPPNAHLVVLYDVGCVIDRSCQLPPAHGQLLQYDILPHDIFSRILFTTNAMHSYVHQWSCQLVYNPRMQPGLGLTDGEGVERLWSRMRKLIGITRTSHVSPVKDLLPGLLLASDSQRTRRIWVLDRHVRFIGEEHKHDLGLWIQQRLKRGVVEQGQKAQVALSECGEPEDVLRTQWEMQRSAQLSVRAHAPTRLKKELDTVLGLQGELESVDLAIEALKNDLTQASTTLVPTISNH
ncbi:hypothetical protein H0H92_007384 [Tricholoma furcatifolium]|nr:hypothetical protein H0H92_007384 [Tricholoma furcatifolium]